MVNEPHLIIFFKVLDKFFSKEKQICLTFLHFGQTFSIDVSVVIIDLCILDFGLLNAECHIKHFKGGFLNFIHCTDGLTNTILLNI